MIHYHGTPLSGDKQVTIRALRGKHAMVSFASPDDIGIIAEICQSFTLDNGAYTAWKQGKVYDPKEYAEWVSEWYRHPGFDWYCIPDVIDGTESDNAAMRAKWRELCPHGAYFLGVPVWHLHESLDELSYLCLAYRRVALGSSGEYAEVGTNSWWHRIGEAMRVACHPDGRPKAKLHGLRMLDPTVFSHIPLSSADSTNVARNIGIDSAWRGTYQPASKESRALIMMERIEGHCSSSKWCQQSSGVQRNMELFG